MRSIDLANEVEQVIQACRTRVLGVGDAQYSQGDQQKFETMEFAELMDWAFEELDDVVVYAVMLRIQLRRLREVMEANSVIRRGKPGEGLAWVAEPRNAD